MPKITIHNGLTTKNISDLDGAIIKSARFAKGADLNEIVDVYGWSSHEPIIILQLRLTNGALIELMPTSDPEGNGPGFIQITPLTEVPVKAKELG